MVLRLGSAITDAAIKQDGGDVGRVRLRRVKGTLSGNRTLAVLSPLAEPALTNPTKQVSGRILTEGGNYLDGALVVLYLAATNEPVATTISDSEGYYSFPRNGYDARTFYVAAWTVTGQPFQSVTRRILTPT